MAEWAMSSELPNDVPSFLQVESKYFIGLFKICTHTNQVKPHPCQREPDMKWTASLCDRFKEVGVAREVYPIKVILAFANDVHALRSYVRQYGLQGIPSLPEHVCTFVFHGQHRVAACNLLEDPLEHWWIAEVYTPELESAYPAEFLTHMHMGNEQEYRLTSSDADRFLVMYKLRSMHQDGVITTEVFKANQERLSRAVSVAHTRHGLSNLLRADELADAVKRVLDRVYLRPTFNASSWGKRLVKGRFFQLAADLLDEMLVQCDLLKGNAVDLTPTPFQLSSSACIWKNIKKSTHKKEHPWNTLPGGAIAALERVRSRPSDFVTYLNPDGTDEWVIHHSVLLPSVLTTDAVHDQLKGMYEVAQHIIKIVAGDDYLNSYTSNAPHTRDDDHPVGIISKVLQDCLKGQASNIPHKVIHALWVKQSELSSELGRYHISNAAATTATQYSTLLNGSKFWQEIILLLKPKRLSGGIILPKAPIPEPGSKAEVILASIRKKQAAVESKQGPAHAISSELSDSHSPSPMSPEHPYRPATESPSPLSRSPSLLIDGVCSESTASQQGTTRRKRPSASECANKKQKVAGDDIVDLGDETEPEPPTDKDDDTYVDATVLSVRGSKQRPSYGENYALRCHYNAQKQLEQLHAQVLNMEPQNARALNQLLAAIHSVKDKDCFGRVIQTLADKAEVVDSAQKDWETDSERESL